MRRVRLFALCHLGHAADGQEQIGGVALAGALHALYAWMKASMCCCNWSRLVKEAPLSDWHAAKG
jgi:hypothetical protein